MKAIEVYRGDCSQPGPDILEPLIGNESAALMRGKAELDAHAQPVQTVRLVMPHRPGLCLGQLVRVTDARQGPAWLGKVTGIEHRLDGKSVLTTLNLERPQ